MIPKTTRLNATILAVAWPTTAGEVLGADRKLVVKLEGLDGGGRFPDRAAFCPPSGAGDVSPGVAWSGAPDGTRSRALLMIDPDVPADLGLIDRPGVSIPRDAPRMRVVHWVLADTPAAITSLPEGIDGRGLVPGGKPVGPTPHGLRGVNVFTTFLAGKGGMAGTYRGYDGPCPPANDARTHRYVVRVYALDTPSLGLSGLFTGEQAEQAMRGHVLADGEASGTYSPAKGP